MNQNSQIGTASNIDPKFVSQARLAYDERVAFVESVCAALIDSRFGNGRTLVRIKKRRELEDIVRLDLGLMETENVSYDLTPQGRMSEPPASAGVSSSTNTLLTGRPLTQAVPTPGRITLRPALARGSP